MFEMFNGILSRLKHIWDSMNMNQKVISGGILVALAITFAYLFTLRTTLIDYSPLYSGLDAKSASEIVSRLEQQKIPYKLSPDGTTIEVPRDKATSLQINLAADGLPSTGIVGFELLDTTQFGISERLQEVNIQRALQGELSKALMSIDAVEWSNVNLSIPEPALFTEMEQPTTAAVILKFKGSRGLSQKQIEGLTNFIGSAVPGLEPRNVAIVDTKGNTLTPTYQDEGALLSSTQWEVKMQVDHSLANKVKQLLDGAFGPGKSLVTVNAQLDWDRIERSTTSYDNVASAMVSEERETETEPTPDGIGEYERSSVNYETGQVVENFVKNPGDISRLSVSVFIDKHDSTWTDAEGDTQSTKVSWSEAKLASIVSIVENAVGFDSLRGDTVEVVESEFGAVVPAGVGAGGIAMGATIIESVRAIVMGLAIIAAIGVFFLIMRSITQSLDPAKMAIKAEKELKKTAILTEEEEEGGESEREIMVRKITKASVGDPEIAAKTLKTFFKMD